MSPHSIDTTKTISKISVLVNGDNEFQGIRLIDEKDAMLLNLSWCAIAHMEGRNWVTKPVPKGWHIVGVRCNTDGVKIQRIGFVLSRTFEK